MNISIRILGLAMAAALAHAQSYSVTTIAGTTTIQDGIPAKQAFLRQPQAIQVDAAGIIYVVDQFDFRIRRIDHDGVITTVAGNGLSGFSGDGGLAIAASLGNVSDIALDRAAANLYIADSGNNRVRRVDLTSGIITTFAGTGSAIVSGDGGAAVNAGLRAGSVTVDASGNVYIGHAVPKNGNNSVGPQLIRKVDAATGSISTFAGGVAAGYTGDGGPATRATLNGPASMATDQQFLYIGEFNNSVIRRIDLTTNVITTSAVEEPSTAMATAQRRHQSRCCRRSLPAWTTSTWMRPATS